MEEVWKDVKGYEGLYQVSNLGRVKSFPRKHSVHREPFIMKQRFDHKGYLQLSLYKNSRKDMGKKIIELLKKEGE